MSDPTTPQAGNLTGCVDRFDAPATIWGWVNTADLPGRGQGVSVRVSLGGRVIAAGPLTHPRPDIVADTAVLAGFYFTCDEEIPDEAFAFGRVLVEALDPEGGVSVLPLYDRARGFALERVLGAAAPFGKYAAAAFLNALLASREISPDAKEAIRGLNDRYFEEEDRNLVFRFESLGKDCALGGMQRAYGAEPLGLWRFSGIGIDSVTAALNNRFAGIGSPEFTSIVTDPTGEYYTIDSRYHMGTHTNVFQGKVDHDEFFQQQCKKIRFLVRNMIEKLEAGEKIFVVHNLPDAISEDRLSRLLAAMRQYGPGPLLYMQMADEAHPPGTVIRREDGILAGYVLGLQGEMMRPEWEIREGWMRAFRAAVGLVGVG
jgi:hypothetical protein